MADDRVILAKRVKEANDIVAVVGSYLPLSPAGANFKAVCPFHDDTRPSLQVSPEYQNYRCWACGARGDVFEFVMKFDRVDFREALEVLARRAGIPLDRADPDPGRLRMLDAMRWACELYQRAFLDSPHAEPARRYLGRRGLTGPTVRAWGLGYAPAAGDWLVDLAGEQSAVSFDTLERVGLIARRTNGAGYYDRFRDRVMFPIRDARGQTVGFGGRVLPDSPVAARGPKYYNSADTPLFDKSGLLYGLDQARHAGHKSGFLAVVEGYTDVLMAHQKGVPEAVATMGTALTDRHVRQLRRFVPRVVLVYDADDGGNKGVDRALELFVGQDVELAVATLPAGQDPCDFLLERDGGAFRDVLTGAKDALDFKLDQLLAREDGSGVEGRRRVMDAILGVMALAPSLPGSAGEAKRELILGRVGQRLGLRVEVLRARLNELRAERREREAGRAGGAAGATRTRRADPAAQVHGKAPPEERELLELLLAEPAFVAQAHARVPAAEVTHPGPRGLLAALYALHEAGDPPDVDGLRVAVPDPALVDAAVRLREVGLTCKPAERANWLGRVLAVFDRRRAEREKQRLLTELSTAGHERAVEILRRVKEIDDGLNRRPVTVDPDKTLGSHS